MKRFLGAPGFAAVFVLAVVAPATAGHEHFPNSTWTLDLVRSNLGGQTLKSDVVSLGADNEHDLSYSEVSVDSKGKVARLWWRGTPNGTILPMRGMPGAFASFTAADDTGHFIYPSGASFSNWFWVSRDRKTLTYQVVGFTASGKRITQTLVYHRSK